MGLDADSTIKELNLHGCYLQSSELTSKLIKYFKENPKVPAIILLEKNRLLGMLSQREFWQYMSRPYSKELCSRRSLKYLWDLLKIENLTIAIDTPIFDAVQIVLARSSSSLEEPVIVKINPLNYKILDIPQLLLACLEIHKQVNQLLIQANQKLKKNLRIDEVTGLGNELIFEEYFAREWDDLAREKAWLSLIRFDVDFFPEYYIHNKITANQSARQIAITLRKIFKEQANLAIYYGEGKFGLLLPNTNIFNVVYLAKKLFNQINDLKIPNSQSSVSNYLTISMGITSLKPRNSEREKQLIQFTTTAEQALDKAKQNGRNCKVIQNIFQPEVCELTKNNTIDEKSPIA